MRNPVEVTMKLKTLRCYDEADGPGTAEPYLWAVFFKVDGDTVKIGDRLSLEGPATVHRSNGFHGNLGTRDVDAGDVVNIPQNIGEWRTILQPIPLSAGARNIVKGLRPDYVDEAGVIGMLCVLMEEDGLPDSSARVGYDTLVSSFTTELNKQISYINAVNQKIDEQAISDAVSKSVEDAIRGDLNIFQSIWAGIVGPDQQIGKMSKLKKSDDLLAALNWQFSERWRGDAGDWELHGEIISREILPVPGSKEAGLTGITVYEDWKYNTESVQPFSPYLRVRKQKFSEGTYNLPFETDLRTAGGWGRTLGVRPNAISSVKVGDEYVCELFSQPNAQGDRLKIEHNTAAMPANWNDKAMSLRVTRGH